VRGQTSLPALGVALVVLVSATLFTVSVAGEQLTGADRDAIERQTAVALSERLVGSTSPVTARENVLRTGALDGVSVRDLRETYGLDRDAAVRVSLDGETVLTAGAPAGGTAVERIVLVQNHTRRTIEPRLDRSRRVTLPRRSSTVTVAIDPTGNSTVETVLANGAVVLRDPDGLSGPYDVDLSRYETATLAFLGTGALRQGDVTITYRPTRTRKASLRVTVQRWGADDG